MRSWCAPVVVRGRAELRRTVTATVVLTVLVGLAAGVVLAAVAGARRTETAPDRLLAYTRLPNVEVQAPDGHTATRIGRLPQVALADRQLYIFLSPTRSGAGSGSVVPIAAADDHSFRSTERLRVIAGRLPAPTAPFDVAVSPLTLQRLHLRLGSHFPLYAYSSDQVVASAAAGSGSPAPPAGPAFTFRVVGVVRAASDISTTTDQDVIYEGNAGVMLTPAFLRAYAAALRIDAEELPGMEFVGIHLRHGLADLAAFRAAARPLLGNQGQLMFDNEDAASIDAARQAVHFQSVALLVFAGLVAAAALLILGQAMARQVALDAAEQPVLRALGMTRAQLVGVALLRALVVGVGGALIAVGVAVALSPLFPTGLARSTEVDPGLSVDVHVLAVGAAAVCLLTVARVALAAWLARDHTGTGGASVLDSVAHHSRVADALARAGLPAPVVAGVRMSLEPGRGRTAVPVRSAMAGAVAAVAGVTAAVVFGVSLSHLVANPRQQGWSWDVLVGNPNSQGDAVAALVPRLVANRQVGAVAMFESGGTLRIAGHDVDVGALRSVKGDIAPVITQGHAPRATDEIALGAATLRTLHRRVGDTVSVSSGDRGETVRIVGTALMPTAGDVLAPKLGTGAILRHDGFQRLFPHAPPPTLFAVRYAAGADPLAAFASIERDFPEQVLRHVAAPEVANLQRVAAMPAVLAGVLAALGVGALGHALVSAVRRRRRDLAVLKTLGFVRRQVAATVAWQATATAVVAVVVGLPLGIAVGRWVWTVMATQVQAPADPVVPILAVAVAVPITLAAANLLAAGPGWLAARMRPATVLRAE